MQLAKGECSDSKERQAREVKFYGIVQGVGFRPHVYTLAQKYDLKGWVLNNSQGVTIHWEGNLEDIIAAVKDILISPPPLARITGHQIVEAHLEGYADFFIQKSLASGETDVLISPDVGICSNCLRELKDSADRRYLYPFINCTDCGPRFTIIKATPYDRKQTTMQKFPMCSRCLEEYRDPAQRRFHAQPNACPECGPQIAILDRNGAQYNLKLSELFQKSAIVAVKGLGGFNLACNALDKKAVRRLRTRKIRDSKPFAVMAANLAVVRRYCYLSAEEEKQLTSPAKPIVILRLKEELRTQLPAEINPGLDTLGVMLPYTPLHYLLFSAEVELLVMTSANIAGEPLITSNAEVRDKLREVADYFIVHDRDIENMCDDSVVMVVREKLLPVRRARGYVPLPIQTPKNLKPLLACGGNLKNTFALTRGNKVFLSQHLGDLDNYLNYKTFKRTIKKLTALLDVQPELIVHDLHPTYQSTSYAQEISTTFGLPTVGIQHHYAHMVSCMAENGLAEEVLGVVCDGTGYGTDGTIWGFEFFRGDYSGFKRLGHLKKVPLLGGDVAVKNPYRMAFSYLYANFGQEGKKLAFKCMPELTEKEADILERQFQKKINSQDTSSCGRLFDAVAACLGICTETKYEGQGPMEMEAAARKAVDKVRKEDFYSLKIEENDVSQFQLDHSLLWEELVDDLFLGKERSELAYKFHGGVAQAILRAVYRLTEETGLTKVVFSGGVFQNKLLMELILSLAEAEKIELYCHHQVPPNDGGISLGQAVAGNEVYKNVLSSTF